MATIKPPHISMQMTYYVRLNFTAKLTNGLNRTDSVNARPWLPRANCSRPYWHGPVQPGRALFSDWIILPLF